MNSKLVLSFSKYSDDSFETKASSILQMLTNNANFPAPVPPLATLQALVLAYQVALVDAKTKDIVKVAVKRAARNALEDCLRNLGQYVMWVANGNQEMLVSSGFDLAKQPEPVALQEPGVVTVNNGISSGRLVASLKKVKGAYSYVYQITTDPLQPESSWTSMTMAQSSAVFTNLTPGQRYFIRVGAVGSGTQIAYSPVASHIAV